MTGWRKRQVIEMAREAGAVFPADGSYHQFERHEDLEAFAKLVAAEEREACAMTAENTSVYDRYSPEDTIATAIRARGQALAQPEQKPMHPEMRKMWEDHFDKCFRDDQFDKCFRAQPDATMQSLKDLKRSVCDAVGAKALAQRTWVGLTDDELEQLSNKWRIIYGGHVGDFAYEIEAKLKEKNT